MAIHTWTSSKNPVADSPPTTIILFPMTAAACYSHFTMNNNSWDFWHNLVAAIIVISIAGMKIREKNEYIESGSRLISSNWQNDPIFWVCGGTSVNVSWRMAKDFILLRMTTWACKCISFFFLFFFSLKIEKK